jgi:putative DNA-invertase from lambdoid prophage Rac
LKAVIYARVSTTDQDPGNQAPVLEGWAVQRGLELVAVYSESESAWKNGHQKELARLLADARHHKFEVVLVWALDRLSREGPAAILNLVNTLGTYKVRVISYQEPWTETTTEITPLLYAITGWVAEMESLRRSERTKAGLARAVANGATLGRPEGAKDKRKRKRRGYLLRYAE